MKAAWRIMKSRIDNRFLLWLFKKRISGLQPQIMLSIWGGKHLAKTKYFSLIFFNTHEEFLHYDQQFKANRSVDRLRAQ